LNGLGIAGEIIPTKGPTEDGIAIFLDIGEAFVGDLLQEHEANELDDEKAKYDWENLQRMGVSKVFPSHFSPNELESKKTYPSRFEKDINNFLLKFATFQYFDIPILINPRSFLLS
jgi:glyoxylase-like metal-dependent hydrolase (beta-lactamase superfamily II)